MKISSVLISVFSKSGIEKVVEQLTKNKVKIYSTGGSFEFLCSKGFEVAKVEDITDYPSILGGRVKTLHPKIFGGILHRRNELDEKDLESYNIPSIDMVICDLYPFKKTIEETEKEEEIIEKIDIGGVALIRAAAKNFKHTMVISNKNQYQELISYIKYKGVDFDEQKRREFALEAFRTTAAYDNLIYHWFSRLPNHFSIELNNLQFSKQTQSLRYGENAHQKGILLADMSKYFTQIQGKTLSYNNLLDIEVALNIFKDFSDENQSFISIIKHNNVCCFALGANNNEAWSAILKTDIKSAFGGIIFTNQEVDEHLALQIDKLFFEVLLAPKYTPKALDIFTKKTKRIILETKVEYFTKVNVRSMLGGILVQDSDNSIDIKKENIVTKRLPSDRELKDLILADILVKHLKSNAITLVKDGLLISYGCGHTSRVDALEHAIKKANEFGIMLQGSVMGSDAFFPFSDCIEIAHEQGVTSVVQPGGSIKDTLVLESCNQYGMAMIFSGIRHFKH